MLVYQSSIGTDIHFESSSALAILGLPTILAAVHAVCDQTLHAVITLPEVPDFYLLDIYKHIFQGFLVEEDASGAITIGYSAVCGNGHVDGILLFSVSRKFIRT